jgi:hypothetical protein
MRSRNDVGPVTAELDARVLTRDSAPVMARIHLRYDIADPYAVRLTVRLAGRAPVPWSFGRELLEDGTRRRIGVGDVSVAPCPDAPAVLLHVTLRDPVSEAVLELSLPPVAAFLQDTYRKVPVGREGLFVVVEDDASALAF